MHCIQIAVSYTHLDVYKRQLEGTTKNIKIDAYAIQTQNINDGKTKLDGINSDGKVKPTDVWAVLERQNPTTTVSVKEEANSDIKQGN